MPGPSVELLFGPFLLGVFLNIFLYGTLVVQSFIYYRSYRKDSPRLRCFILFLFICDTLNTIFDIGVIYEPLVFRYGTPRAVEHIPVMLYVDPLMTVIISTSVQLFICWRISIIRGSWVVPCFIAIFVFCSLVGGIATTVCSTILSDFAQLEQFKGAVITWLASSAIADICITTALVISLVKRRTGHARTDDAIDRIIRLTIHTGAVTALFATLDVVLFIAVPGTTLNFFFDFPLAKLYTNSLLSTLNARGGWYIMAQQRPHDNVLFGTLKSETHHSSRISASTKTGVTIEFGNGSKTTTYPDPIPLSAPSGSVSLNHQMPKATYDVDLESVLDINGGHATARDTDDTTTDSMPVFYHDV